MPPALSAWMAELAGVWPQLSRPQIKLLAQYSMGMVLAEASGLSRVSFCLARWLGQGWNTVRERLRDFYCGQRDKSGQHRRELPVETCFAGLLAWILRSWRSDHLALALDASTLDQRFVVLAISVVYRCSAMPVAWKILPATAKEAWKPHWLRLLQVLEDAVPPGMHVIVLADRGLYAKWLFRAIVARHWHPFLRINGENTQFRPAATGRYQPVTQLVAATGQSYAQPGILFRGRAAQLPCTLVGCWSAGYTDPWLVATDLPARQTEPAWYGLRAWIERGFKHGKSGGWRWQHTRMTDPQRGERLWLIMALAQVLAMREGSGAAPPQATSAPPDPAPPAPSSPTGAAGCAAPAPRPRPPILSVFLVGLLTARMILCTGTPLAPQPALVPTPWPTGLPTCTAPAHPSPLPRPP